MEKKTKLIQVRVTRGEQDRIRWLAGQYTNGNVSEWMLYAALEAPRKLLKFRDKK